MVELSPSSVCSVMRISACREESLEQSNEKRSHVLYVSVLSSSIFPGKRSAWTIFFLKKSAISRPSFRLFLKASWSVTEY